jgi:malonyl-CoA O-methyltransferase
MQVKQQVINNFSLQASAYDDHAGVQRAAANLLADAIKSAPPPAPGPILEIGCGTGYLTMPLIECFPTRQIIVSDLSPQMLDQCRQRIVQNLGKLPDNVELRLIDGETFEESTAFASIVSSFALQWLANLETAVMRLLNSLKSGGSFFFSVPSSHSFPEWKRICADTGVPFTGNPLPDMSLFSKLADTDCYQTRLSQESFSYVYPSLLHFLRDLKELGASTSISRDRLSVKELSRLNDYSKTSSPSGVSLTYEIIFGHIVKR